MTLPDVEPRSVPNDPDQQAGIPIFDAIHPGLLSCLHAWLKPLAKSTTDLPIVLYLGISVIRVAVLLRAHLSQRKAYVPRACLSGSHKDTISWHESWPQHSNASMFWCRSSAWRWRLAALLPINPAACLQRFGNTKQTCSASGLTCKQQAQQLQVTPPPPSSSLPPSPHMRVHTK